MQQFCHTQWNNKCLTKQQCPSVISVSLFKQQCPYLSDNMTASAAVPLTKFMSALAVLINATSPIPLFEWQYHYFSSSINTFMTVSTLHHQYPYLDGSIITSATVLTLPWQYQCYTTNIHSMAVSLLQQQYQHFHDSINTTPPISLFKWQYHYFSSSSSILTQIVSLTVLTAASILQWQCHGFNSNDHN